MTGNGTRLPVVGGARVAGEPPRFQRIAIVGIGAFGASLAMAVRRAWPQSLVIGVDTADAIEAAIRLHAIDVGSGDLMIAGEADLIALTGGPDENNRVMPYLADAITGEATVLVVGGSDALTERARSLPGRLQVVEGVPNLDRRGNGIQAASADLFRGRSWTITPVTAGRESVESIHSLVRAISGSAGPAAPQV